MSDEFASPERIAGLCAGLELLASAVVLLDESCRIRYMNPGAENLFEVSQRKLVGFPLSELLGHSLELAGSIENALADNWSYTGHDLHIERSGTEVLRLDCTVTPVDAAGLRLLLEFRPIDAQLRVAREEQLIQQQKANRELMRNLAHEIKNPLGGLRGAAQLLEAELDSAELREYTRIIIQEADRLQELLNRMLGPNRRPSYSQVNIHHVLERVRTLVLAEAGTRIRVVRDYDPSIPELIGDMDQLIQAVLNIARNAVRALDEAGTITLRTRIQRQLTIGAWRYRLVAQVDIVDDGPGIPPEIADTLFLPMVTAGTGGMGLGLSIAQSLINQHKGLIECTSREGETVFTIYLPIGSDPGAERQGDTTHD